MKLFNETLNQLYEIHCWKGYRKVGTKLKNGKRVNDCRPIKKEGIDDARHPGRLKRLVTKRFGKGKITCSKARTMASSKNTLTKKQANRFLNYHGCR